MILLDAIELSEDLEWIDEIQWTPVMQDVQYSATGALLIQESEKQAGRPITLQGREDMAWANRDLINALQVKKNTVGLEMTLILNGVTRTVKFRQGETPVDVSPVLFGNFFDSESWYKINAIRLMEVI